MLTARPPLVLDAAVGEGSPRMPRPPLNARSTVARRSFASTRREQSRGSFLTDGVSVGSMSNLDEKVEYCVFPGVDDCTELPGGLPAAQLMHDGVRLVHFASRTHEARFAKCWSSKQCEEMMVAFVWHTICQHFKPNPEAQDALFSRIATSFAMLFGTVLSTMEAKDVAGPVGKSRLVAPSSRLRGVRPGYAARPRCARRAIRAL